MYQNVSKIYHDVSKCIKIILSVFLRYLMTSSKLKVLIENWPHITISKWEIKMYQNVLKDIKMYQDVSRCIKMYQNALKYLKVYFCVIQWRLTN